MFGRLFFRTRVHFPSSCLAQVQDYVWCHHLVFPGAPAIGCLPQSRCGVGQVSARGLPAAGSMVLKCPECRQRTDRTDGSCSSQSCARYRAARRGAPGVTHGFYAALGPLMGSLTAYVDGGFILTLSHRHDIRVGIASGMYLRELVTDVRLRLEILCVLHLCYWRWSTRLLLQALCARIEDYVVMQPMARVEFWRDAWKPMELEMEDKQVVSWPAKQSVELWTRDAVKRTRRAGEHIVHAHHPCMNPSSRRSGSNEFAMLMSSLADGSLWRACDEIAEAMNEKPSYAGVIASMKKHRVSLWESGGYTCIRWRMIQHVRRYRGRAWSASYRSSTSIYRY